jgi:aminoglycoside phosphotransferase (APT) family kinase protein
VCRETGVGKGGCLSVERAELPQDGRLLRQLIVERLGCPVKECHRVGQGFYAAVYRLSIEKVPYTLIAKCHKYRGYSARERDQLQALARHSAIRVPEVYHVHEYSDRLPFEALIMEYVPGVNASKLEFPTKVIERQFVEAIVRNLLAWHAISNPRGFGQIGGPFYGTWTEYFQHQISGYHEAVHQEQLAAAVSGYVMGVIDRSFAALAQIFRNSAHVSSLVHGDYNLWNVLADPDTCEPTGIIDPIDAGWADREIDLFHLANCRPELGLLNRYLQEIELDGLFRVRYTFYRFWDDVKHYVRMGWYDEGRFSGYARELEVAMDAARIETSGSTRRRM